MPIIQRCSKCQWRFPLDADVCPNPKCSTPVPRGLRNLYFRTKIKGKRHEKAAGRVSIQEARIKYAEWVVELGTPVYPDTDKITFKDVATAYLDKLRAEKKPYEKEAKLFLQRMKDQWGQVFAFDITADMVKRFQTALRAGGASPAYCDRHLAIGKAAWNHSLSDTPNPFKRVKMYRPDNVLVRRLTQDEETRLLDAAKKGVPKAPKNLHVIVLLGIRTGLRKNNILRLHTRETDFDERTIRVRQKRNLTHEIPMSQEVYEALLQIKPEAPGYYFPSRRRHDGQPYTRFEGTWKTLKKAAGITKPFRFHDTRHHFGSTMAKRTGNIVLVQKALGHRNIETTMKYVHVWDGELRDALEDLSVLKVV